MPKNQKLKIVSGNVLPNQIIRAYKTHGDKGLIKILFDSPKSSYGYQNTVTPYNKYINMADEKGDEEWHHINIDIVGFETPRWLPKPNDNSDDGDNKSSDPYIAVLRSSTYVRKDKKTGEDVIEKFGEALWAIDQSTMYHINKAIEKEKVNFKNEKVSSMFQLYRAYNDEDKENGIKPEKIDGKKKVKLEDPVARIGLSFFKDSKESRADIKDLNNAKWKRVKDKKILVIPTATVNGSPITSDNIGKFITKGSAITCIVRNGDIISHSFGISSKLELGAQAWEDNRPVIKLFVKRAVSDSNSDTSAIPKEERDMMMLQGMDIPDADSSESSGSKARQKAKKAAADNDKGGGDASEGETTSSATEAADGTDSDDASTPPSDESSSKKSKKDKKKDKKSKKDKKEKKSKKDKSIDEDALGSIESE